MRVSGGVATRLLHVEGSPVLVRAWQPGRRAGRAAGRAGRSQPRSRRRGAARRRPRRRPAPAQLELAVERMRFALGVDDDLGEFYRRFRRDPLLGPLLRRRPVLASPPPALALGGARLGGRQAADRDRARGPDPAPHRRPLGRCGWAASARRCATSRRRRLIAGRAPAELESMGLALRRAIALRAVAREVAAGALRPRPSRPPTGACSRCRRSAPGPSSASASSAAATPTRCPPATSIYLKLVGRLARLGRRATVEEVEEFYAPYAPFRGLAGALTWPAAPARRPGPAAALRRLSPTLRAVPRRGADQGPSIVDSAQWRGDGTGTGPRSRSTSSSTRSPPAGEDYRRLVERLPGDRLRLRAGRARALALRQPPGRGDPRLQPRGVDGGPGAVGASCCTPRTGSGRSSQETRKTLGDRNPPPVDYRMITRDGDVVWILDEAVLEPDEDGAPVWHGVLYDITERKIAEQELQRAAAQQAAVARLGGRALKDGDPDSLMRAAVSLMTEIEGVDGRLHLGGRSRRPPPAACAPAWRAGGRGRPARLGGARLPRRRRARLGPARDRRRLVGRAALHDAAGAAGARGAAAASRC